MNTLPEQQRPESVPKIDSAALQELVDLIVLPGMATEQLCRSIRETFGSFPKISQPEAVGIICDGVGKYCSRLLASMKECTELKESYDAAGCSGEADYAVIALQNLNQEWSDIFDKLSFIVTH